MKSVIGEQTAAIRAMQSSAEIRLAVVAHIRLLLQHICLGLLEWISERGEVQSLEALQGAAEALRRPTDGELVRSLSDLCAVADGVGWRGIGRLPHNQVPPQRASHRLIVGEPQSVEGLLVALVRRRNDGAEGHGLPGDFDSEAEIDALEAVLAGLEPLVPSLELATSRYQFGPTDDRISLELVRPLNGRPVLVRRITSVPGGRCRVTGQVQINLNDRESVTYECRDVLSVFGSARRESYIVVQVPGQKWYPLVLMPDRLTDTFLGRQKELAALTEWFDDSESRACLIHGDGGLGKTALVVEFLRRIIEGSVEVAWKPECITFFTAKRTRWGVEGLEVIQTATLGIADLAIDVYRGMEGSNPGSDWFRMDATGVLSRLQNHLREGIGLVRESHLIVVDNAETMVDSAEEAQALAGHVREVSRRLGRVIVTSRRREAIEAQPIALGELSPDEAVQLLRRRGADRLHIRLVRDATDVQLRELSKELGHRPIVLEAFLHALEDPQCKTFRRAVERVGRLQESDLGDFLFADAWTRLGLSIRHLVLLMARVSEAHDSVLIKLCSDEAKVSALEAERALEESGGIASITRFEGRPQVVFSRDFLRFARDKTVSASGKVLPSDAEVSRVRARYAAFLKAASRIVRDRLGIAFRHPLARAAFFAAESDQFDEAIYFYQEASVADPGNGWLLDRFAFFLATKLQLHAEALDKARRATILLPEECEVWFTRGMIEARLGEDAFVASFVKAEALGMPKHRCAIQRAWGYLRMRPPRILEAEQEADRAQRQLPEDAFRPKNLSELGYIAERVRVLKKKLRR